MSILIVDDQPDNIFLVKRLLERAGFEDLHTASSVKEAFHFLGLGKSSPRDIDLVLMDIMMPEVDGIEACRTLKADSYFKDVPVVMMTALTDVESLQAAFEAGAVDYVTKPLRSLEVLARIRSALRLKHETDCRKKREEELNVRNQELEKALSEIKMLRGFLPICSYCKSIRDDKGYWNQLEAYMSRHSELVFSHSICEPCMKKNFPDFVKEKEKKEKKF